MNRRPPSRSSNDDAARRSRATAWSMIERLEGRQLLATFNVNSLLDAAAVNAATGDATSTLGAGKITLRSAIQAADATAGPSTINLPAGTYTLSIPAAGADDAASGDLNITGSLTLAGAGAATTTINANKIDRVLNISTGDNSVTGVVAVLGVTITGGDDSAANPNSQGGRGGGGIYLQGDALTLTDCVVSGNVANDYGGGGGGIYSTGANLTLNRTTVDSNVARDKSTGAGGLGGGGIFAAFGQTTILNSTISRNQVGDAASTGFSGVVHSGGGIANNFGGKLIVTNSTIRDNIVYGDYGGASQGGGIYDNVGQVTLTDSMISGNQAVDVVSGDFSISTGGGGIANFGSFLMSFLNITDCTISGNRSTGPGGGLFLNPSVQASSSSDGSITGSTIADNISAGGGAGIYFNEPQPYTIRNTILSRNFGDGPVDHENYTRGPQGGVITSLGHNISTDETTAAVFTATGDLNSVADVKLGPLADNGGPTFTRALLPGSPAIDAGDPAGAPATDQRGEPRIQGATIDVGAFEFPAIPAISLAGTPAGPTTFHQSVTFTATVSPPQGTPGPIQGEVAFLDGPNQIAQVKIDGTDHAVFSTSSLAPGTHAITAVLLLEGAFTSNVVSLVVKAPAGKVVTTTHLDAAPNSVTDGQSTTLTAIVSATSGTVGAAAVATPTGTVTFTIDGEAQAPTPLHVVHGQSQAALAKTFSSGAHRITATYNGDSAYAASMSNVVSVTVAAATPPATVAPTVTGLARYGFHAQPTAFVLTFDAPLDPIRARDVGNYRLTPSGEPRAAIPIAAAFYNSSENTVALYPARRVQIHRQYQLVINGSATTGLRGLNGAPLDGFGDGTPGSSFSRTFGGEILAGTNFGRVPRPFAGTQSTHASVHDAARAVAIEHLANRHGLRSKYRS